MRAIQFSEYGSCDTLQRVELPQPIPEPGHIVVKMTAAAINPLDNLLRQGRVSFGQHPPLILGDEGAGVIATEGSDLPVGTRVMLRRAYHLPRGGTWQEYVLAPVRPWSHCLMELVIWKLQPCAPPMIQPIWH